GGDARLSIKLGLPENRVSQRLTTNDQRPTTNFSSRAVAVEVMGERLSGVGLLHARDLLGSALGDQAAAVFSPLGAEIDEPVGIADDIQIVLDDDDGVAQVREAMQDVQQLLHVVEMQAGRGLVKQV